LSVDHFQYTLCLPLFTLAAKTLCEFGYKLLSTYSEPHEISIPRPRIIHFAKRNRDLDSESVQKKVSGASESVKLLAKIKQVHQSLRESFASSAKIHVDQTEQYSEQMDSYRKSFGDMFKAETSKKRKG